MQITTRCTLHRPGWTDPLIAPVVKTLKLAIYLFLEFWLQIWFQKYCISPNDTQFLINKDKNRGTFFFTFPPMGAMRGSILPEPHMSDSSRCYFSTSVLWKYCAITAVEKSWSENTTKVEAPIVLKIGNCSYCESRISLFKNIYRKWNWKEAQNSTFWILW
jgi:hypothetical protein